MTEQLLINGADIKDLKVLCNAVLNGRLKILEDLLKNGADADVVDNSYSFGSPTPLHIAVHWDQIESAELLIKYGANVNIKDGGGPTPLICAIKSENTKMIELLLTNGADVNVIDNTNSCGSPTPLHIAVHRGLVEMAKLLINYGANVNIKDGEGPTPIIYAIQTKYTEMIKLLVTNGADIKEDPKVLHTAVAVRCVKLVEDALKSGADPNMTDNSSFYKDHTALHIAAMGGQLQMAKLLINYGANVNIKSGGKTTPIIYAIQNENAEMIKLLLTNGADIKDNLIVLCAAAGYGHLKLVEDVLKDGVDVNRRYDSELFDRTTPLGVAVFNNDIEMAKLLINYGANVNLKLYSYDQHPIVHAIENGSTEMIELLVTNGADIKEDPMVLCAAAEHESLKLAEDLLKNGADPNMADNSLLYSGMTPLYAAVNWHQIESAKLLIKYGAHVNTKDNKGYTPILVAVLAKNTEMIKLLLTNGADIEEDVYTDLLHVDSPTTKILKQHIAKVKAAGLYVSEINLLWISNDYEINNFLNECEAEIQIMKSEKIDISCASFYDILTKNTSELAKNESIVQAWKSDGYKTMFPIYASMIDSRFRRGLEREELLEQVRKKFLHSLFESLPELPVLCTEKIFSYLSDRDLRILLVA